MSRMDILSNEEIDNMVNTSKLVKKYNKQIDRESAHEILMERIEVAQELPKYQPDKMGRNQPTPKPTQRRTTKETGMFEKIMKSPVTNTIAREVTRGILGVLGLKTIGTIARTATKSKRTTTRR